MLRKLNEKQEERRKDSGYFDTDLFFNHTLKCKHEKIYIKTL